MVEDKPALVLIHGLGSSAKGWQDVAPLLTGEFNVYTPTALGHAGGPPVDKYPVLGSDMVDWAEEYLDEQGLDRPHVAGHSMGGFIALELARRGRAETACAISPGGFWKPEEGQEAFQVAKEAVASARRARHLIPVLYRVPQIRKRAMRGVSGHPERVGYARALEAYRDVIACTIHAKSNLGSEHAKPLDPVPCPVTIAWAERDEMLPLATHGQRAREFVPQATFTILRDVGHEALLDNPALVAQTIVSATIANGSNASSS